MRTSIKLLGIGFIFMSLITPGRSDTIEYFEGGPFHPRCVYIEDHSCRMVWVPGKWVEEEVKVWVPGEEKWVWVEPVIGEAQDALTGTTVKKVIDGNFHRMVEEPGQYEMKKVRRYIPGHFKHVVLRPKASVQTSNQAPQEAANIPAENVGQTGAENPSENQTPGPENNQDYNVSEQQDSQQPQDESPAN